MRLLSKFSLVLVGGIGANDDGNCSQLDALIHM